MQVIGPNGSGFLGGVVAISTGNDHTVALKSDGTVFAWGRNVDAQLGDGTSALRTTPIPVVGKDRIGFLSGVVSLSARGIHTAAIRSEGTIVGTVSLEDTFVSGNPLQFEFRPVGGGVTLSRNVTPRANGAFSFFDIPPGEYVVAVKGNKWLRQAIPNVITLGGNNVIDLRFTLSSGDANDDNVVDVLDLDALIQAFDSDSGSPHWNGGAADFNCDGSVDVLDLDILIRNFDLMGTP